MEMKPTGSSGCYCVNRRLPVNIIRGVNTKELKILNSGFIVRTKQLKFYGATILIKSIVRLVLSIPIVKRFSVKDFQCS